MTTVRLQRISFGMALNTKYLKVSAHAESEDPGLSDAIIITRLTRISAVE